MMLWNDVNVTKLTIEEMADMVCKCKTDMVAVQGILSDIQQTLELRELPKYKLPDAKEFLGILNDAGEQIEDTVVSLELLTDDLDLLADSWVIGTVTFRDQPEDVLAVMDGQAVSCITLDDDGIPPDRVDS